MSRVLVNIPPKAKQGEVISIKALIQHQMETGFRYTTTGEPIRRDIITHFVATWEGEEIFQMQLSPAVAANPYIVFHTVAEKSGTVALTWTGDDGFAVTETAKVVVE